MIEGHIRKGYLQKKELVLLNETKQLEKFIIGNKQKQALFKVEISNPMKVKSRICKNLVDDKQKN